jgi:DNA-binding CsgD family transcriptional regulator
LAGLEPDRAQSAAAELGASQILTDAPEPRFRHPLLRGAVELEASAIELASQHRRAAELLSERGAAAGRIAMHLLPSAPGGEGWVVSRLRDAARSARSQGATEQAAVLLRRALAEPPPRELRAALLRELGEIELTSRHEQAAEPLREALELASDPGTRADLVLSLALALYHVGRHAEAVDALLATIAEIEGDDALRERRLRLEAFLALAGRYDVETEERTRGRIQEVAAGLHGSTPGERLVLATAASERPGPTADDLFHSTRTNERVTREIPWPDPVEGIGFVAMYLHAGRPDAAAEAVESLLAKAREEGSPLGHAIAVGVRGMVALDGGDLRAADADLAECLGALHDLGDLTLAHRTAGLRLTPLGCMGRFEDAERLMAEYELAGRIPEQMYYNPTLHARGLLRLEQRRFADAEADFRELGRRHELWKIERPVPPWRSGAALALIAQGEPDRAAELAAEELELARVWNTSKAIAIATGALALTREGDDAIAGLAEAVGLLEDTPWRLDRARARCDLGAALRRAGRRREGREQLARAMDEANACGAETLAERAADELRASGARPRRRAISGLDALTPSERRVADLAAAGRTNREIAQELFVTMATVETHLTRVYRKLDLDGREGLPAALRGEA